MNRPQAPESNSNSNSNASSDPTARRSSGATGGDLPPDIPEAVTVRKWLPSFVWLIPILAALIGIALVIKTALENGPTITISFANAEGLEAGGKTKVKFKDVDIGSVKTIKLSDNRAYVIVEVQLAKEASSFAAADTRFWVVRPRIGANGVSGLNTLLSGPYIGVDAGHSKETQSHFIGLETPPAVTGDQKGRPYILQGDSLSSLDIGSPVYYRSVQVGQVVSFSLDKDGKGVTIGVFINAPYDQYVSSNSRWWHASGVDLRLDSNGLKLNTQSLATVLVGGLAFQSPPGQAVGEPADSNTVFALAHDESDAMRPPDNPPLTIVMNFNQSLRGLSPGAAVDFRGIVLGEVTNIDIDYDPKARNFTMPVTINLYPNRLGKRFREFEKQPGGANAGKTLLEQLVAHGLRAQLRTGNLLTGQLYVALDIFPHASHVKLDTTRTPLELPTVPNTLSELQLQVAEIAKKLNSVPFDKIGVNLNSTLEHANSLFKQLDTQVAPQASDALNAAKHTFDAAQATLQQDSPLQSDLHRTLDQLRQTLQSLNALADYLERHPEALLRGKPGDKP